MLKDWSYRSSTVGCVLPKAYYVHSLQNRYNMDLDHLCLLTRVDLMDLEIGYQELYLEKMVSV